MSGIWVCSALQHRGGGHAGIHLIYFQVALCMATTSVCSLLQHRDASHDAGIISCPSCSLKVIIFYAALCICQQRVFQVFFDIYLYLIFNIVYMTASCLLPAYATYRNAQLMVSLLSYFSSKRHIVFSEPVITVLYCHSTFLLALTSTSMDLHCLESCDGALRPLYLCTNYSSLHYQT